MTASYNDAADNNTGPKHSMPLDQMQDHDLIKTASYIDGTWNAGADSFAVSNPANGDIIARVTDAGAEETRRAIAAAERALPAWRARSGKERAGMLRRWFELIMAKQEDLARLMTLEQGKPLAEARAEIAYAASFVEWFAEEAKRVDGDVLQSTAGDRRFLTLKQPVGVVAAITPWNFPSAMLTRKAAPALAVGCTIVIKPSEETPLSALALAELAQRAGLPAGTLNIVVGRDAAAIGAELTTSTAVRKLSFTGSTAVGKRLLRDSAATVKKVSMELGGNAPIIVFDDADLELAIAGAIGTKFRNAGQTCICANRVLVQDGIYDAFVEKFTAAVAALKVGPGLIETNQIGPLITPAALIKVDGLVQDAIAAGAQIVVGGARHSAGEQFYQPTVITHVSADMRVHREEIFGPVAPVFRFSDEAEAIALANDTEYGLAAYFYSRDVGRVWRVSEALDYGMVGVNEVGITSEVIPFGGVKESGLGREGSRYGVEDYLETKYVCMGGLDR